MLLSSWADLNAHTAKMDHLTEQERQDAGVALIELQNIFGNQYFDERHPLFFRFAGGWIWPFKWVVPFSCLLSSLKSHPDFARLIEDLRNGDRFDERMSILEILEILLPKGFCFSLDSKVEVSKKIKKPDIYIQLGQQEPGFFMEVSSLSQGHKERQATRVFRTIHEMFWRNFHQLTISGRCERVLSDIHLNHVVEQVRAAAEKATATSGFEKVELDGVLQLAMAIKAKEENLQKWAVDHGLEVGEFRGPGADVSEISRLSIKLQEEQKQLPKDRANVIVIHSHLFCDSPGSPETFEYLVHHLEEEIFRFPHVAWVVLVFRWIGNHRNPGFRHREHICVNRKRFDILCDTSLIFKNRFAATALSKEVEAAFVTAFQEGVI